MMMCTPWSLVKQKKSCAKPSEQNNKHTKMLSAQAQSKVEPVPKAFLCVYELSCSFSGRSGSPVGVVTCRSSVCRTSPGGITFSLFEGEPRRLFGRRTIGRRIVIRHEGR